ncbi:YrhK family protein [Halomonas sp. YLGW01]|uniref:YrhK family protein n=1 Tax=Halomonas sp. YLGW01 TaxID=2773308 RepID=UPI0017871924|nr:YrhK family protein [Halomonas sp. YLGW01]
MASQGTDNTLILRLGHEELIIRRRYEALSIFNDVLIALWFLAGSILFLYPSQEHLAVWLFIIGSAQFLVRPAIRLARHLHLKRLPDPHGGD